MIAVGDVVWQAAIAAGLAIALAWIGYKVQSIAKTNDAVHTLVNSNMGLQLKVSEIAHGRLARLPNASRGDIEAWEKSKEMLAAHIARQAVVDSKS